MVFNPNWAKNTINNVVIYIRVLCGKEGIRTKKEEGCKKDLFGENIRTYARKITIHLHDNYQAYARSQILDITSS